MSYGPAWKGTQIFKNINNNYRYKNIIKTFDNIIQTLTKPFSARTLIVQFLLQCFTIYA